eukprot:m.127990 g.127990  ORF g.127990 m.127990 type:complete len:226 (-) comp9740_c1_seq5:1584-2261(-)
MAFTAKYGNGDEIGTDDECAKALRDAGFKIVRFGDSGLVYVGQTDYDDKPDGHGYMYLPSGDLHEGEFVHGRANGPGIYMTAAGSTLKGEWKDNRRTGVFSVVDGNGVQWTEKYNAEGKRTARKKKRIDVPNPDFDPAQEESKENSPTIQELADTLAPAAKCYLCDCLAHPEDNHAWACRSHKGRWAEDRDFRGSGERPGVWSCCGRQTRTEPGCSFQEHNFQKS